MRTRSTLRFCLSSAPASVIISGRPSLGGLPFAFCPDQVRGSVSFNGTFKGLVLNAAATPPVVPSGKNDVAHLTMIHLHSLTFCLPALHPTIRRFQLARQARRDVGHTWHIRLRQDHPALPAGGIAAPRLRPDPDRQPAADPPASAHGTDPARLRPAALGHRPRERRTGVESTQLLRRRRSSHPARLSPRAKCYALAGTAWHRPFPISTHARFPAANVSGPRSRARSPCSPTCC